LNIVLVADKKVRKIFEPTVRKNPSINLLGVEMLIRGNTVSRITEHHNPHAVVIYRDVPEKDGMTVNDVISFLRVKRPAMRIIYVFGNVKDKHLFYQSAEFLTENKVFDIVTSNDVSRVMEVIDNPMTEDDINRIISELEAEDAVVEEKTVEKEEDNKVYEELAIDFPTVTAISDFDIDRVEKIVTAVNTEQQTVVIGLTQLQHHNGCTHTAFEIAMMLSQKNSVAVVIADNETYDRLLGFHKISSLKTQDGVIFQGIHVYPYSKFEEIQSLYGAVVCDFGMLREHLKKSYDECHVKIMLCSSAEWDIAVTTNYIKFSDDRLVREINYCFPRVARSKFVKYSKQFRKSGCNSYRLHDSPDWTAPCTDNCNVYREILKQFSIRDVPKSKKKLMKV